INLHKIYIVDTWLYGSWPHGVFKKLGIPGPKALPFFGTMLEYRKVSCVFEQTLTCDELLQVDSTQVC
uniref:Uncharacterized protein n=1 Tax=Sinocyclocheilus rhinocerous TaxID=307959 RepID=A0A673GZL2_9TELE